MRDRGAQAQDLWGTDYPDLQDAGDNPGAVIVWGAVVLIVWGAILLGAAVLA